jgi:hypothetical protein
VSSPIAAEFDFRRVAATAQGNMYPSVRTVAIQASVRCASDTTTRGAYATGTAGVELQGPTGFG